MLLVLKEEYSRKTRSKPWLLMPWLCVARSATPQYWLCSINRSLSSMRMDFNYLCHLSVEILRKCIYLDASWNKFGMARIDTMAVNDWWVPQILTQKFKTDFKFVIHHFENNTYKWNLYQSPDRIDMESTQNPLKHHTSLSARTFH